MAATPFPAKATIRDLDDRKRTSSPRLLIYPGLAWVRLIGRSERGSLECAP